MPYTKNGKKSNKECLYANKLIATNKQTNGCKVTNSNNFN